MEDERSIMDIFLDIREKSEAVIAESKVFLEKQKNSRIQFDLLDELYNRE